MDKKGKQQKMEAKESAPMPTKGRKGADFKNQTTNTPKNRFPLTTIIIVLVLLGMMAFLFLFVDGTTSS